MVADLERTYVIPLRRAFLRAPRYNRAKRAVSEVRSFISRHMKAPEVHIGKFLNEQLWARGIRKPPTRVTVTTKKHDNVAYVELAGHDFAIPKHDAKEDKLAQLKKDVHTQEHTATPAIEEKSSEKPRKRTPKKLDQKVNEKLRSDKIIAGTNKQDR